MLHRSGAEGIIAQPLYAKKKTKYYKERNEEARKTFVEKIVTIPVETIVYVDETGIDEYFHRDKCRAKRGIKVYDSVSGRKYIRTNIVAAQCNEKIIAPLEYVGATDHYVFELWFEKMLLAQLPEGQTIVMDNASFHRKKVLNELVRQAKSEIMFLPVYSPDFNLIEKTWANLKSFLRN